MEKINRVDKPTTLITDDIKQVPKRAGFFVRAFYGDLGPTAGKKNPPVYHQKPSKCRRRPSSLETRTGAQGRARTGESPHPRTRVNVEAHQGAVPLHGRRSGRHLRNP
jgi:hypothetical protein